MSWVNLDDVIGQLLDAGFKEPSSGWESAIDCGRRAGVRCRVEGVRQGGAIALHTIRLDDGRDALIGAGWYYKAAEKIVVKIQLRVDAKPVTLSKEAREAAKARLREMEKAAEADLKRRQDKAARQAMHTWARCASEGTAAYLEKKGIKGYGVKFSPGGAVVVPMADTHGRIHGLQVIRPAKKNGRDKDFWPAGLAKKGHFHQIGLPVSVVLIAEGYATGASLHEATGLPVVVAFDAGNLSPVAAAIHKKYPRAKVLVCADDDYLTDGNPGVTSASNAALAVGGAWVSPAFAADRAGKKITDFNDLHALEGIGAVRAQIEARLSALGWDVAAPPRADAAPQGGGGRRAAQSVMSLDEVVDRFRPIDDGTGEVVFDTWTNRVARHKQMIALLPAGVRGDDIKRHPVWVERGAHYLDEVGFDPSGKDATVKLNTWQGWPMQPKAGCCDRLLEHIYYLCSDEGDEKAREVMHWLLCWMAWPLQHPGAKMASAVVMHGPQGTGKSAVFQTLAKIYGSYSTVLNQRGLEDKFNADWADSKLFILAEEVVTRAEMWHIKNELKELVTGEWIRINPKNVAAYRQRNQINIAYLSNEGQPLPLENDDRRHLVIWNPPALSEAYYDDLWVEIQNGGAEAFYAYLLAYDTSGFHPKKRPPMTNAKEQLMALSSPSEVRFLTEWITGRVDLPVCPALATDVYAAYLRWCRANGEARPRASNQFHGVVHRMPGWAKKDAQVYLRDLDDKSRTKAMVFPPDDAIARDGRAMPAGAKVARWLGECLRAFAEANEGDAMSRAA